MAFLRTRVLLAVLLWVGIANAAKEYDALCKDKKTEDDAFNAQDCAVAMNTMMEKAPAFLSKSKLKCFNVSNPEPCPFCEIEGVDKIKLFKNTTAKSLDCPSTGDCLDHSFYFLIPHLKAKCFCELDANPVGCVAQMQSVLTTENFGLKCNAPPGVHKNLPKPDVKSVCGDPSNFLKLKSCAPLPDIPGVKGGLSMGKRAASTKQSGIVRAKWDAVKLKITIRACKKDEPKTVVMAGAELVDAKTDALICTCEGPDAFLKPCACLIEANFLKAIIMQAVQFIFPCYCDEATKGYEGQIAEMQCLDNYF